jgi:hypothetical protein
MESLLSKKREKNSEDEDPLYDIYLRLNVLENIVVGPGGNDGLLKKVNYIYSKIDFDDHDKDVEECKDTPNTKDCDEKSISFRDENVSEKNK